MRLVPSACHGELAVVWRPSLSVHALISASSVRGPPQRGYRDGHESPTSCRRRSLNHQGSLKQRANAGGASIRPWHARSLGSTLSRGSSAWGSPSRVMGCRGHQATVDTKPPWPPSHRGHQATVDTRPPWPPSHRGHQATVATKPPWTPSHLGHQAT